LAPSENLEVGWVDETGLGIVEAGMVMRVLFFGLVGIIFFSV
jgi:hypothetical protein